MKTKILTLLLFAITNIALSQTYCTPLFSSTNPNDGPITNVYFWGSPSIFKSSGLGTTSPGYSDFTDLSVGALEVPSTSHISIGFQVTVAWHTGYYARIWIDKDKNGVFDDSEMVYNSGSSKKTHSGTLQLYNMAAGSYRIRVIAYYNSSNISPCQTGHYGEAEDYTLVISCPTSMGTVTGDQNQIFNVGQTLADLVVNGDNLAWYSNASLTSAIPTTTPLVHGATYYVVRQYVTCKSSALAITTTDYCTTVTSKPTGNTNQTFNAGETLAYLVVNGSNLVWYPNSSLTTPIPATTPLVNGQTYYVREEIGDCKSSALAITVMDCVYAVSTPTGDANQTFNTGQKIADLVVGGSNLVWYANPALITPIPNTTTLIHGTTYYVAEKIGNCKSSALAITVSDCIILAPTPTTGDVSQFFSDGQTLADLDVNGQNLVWYSDAALTTIIPATTELVSGTTYYVVSKDPDTDCQSEALAIAVTDCNVVAPTPIGDAVQFFTTGETLADLDVTGTNLIWYLDSALSVVIPTTIALVNGTTYYVVSDDPNTHCISEALAIMVTNDCSFVVATPIGATTQTFNAGQTIADLDVNGQNLVWSSSSTFSDTLSDSEPLVDGATYYVRSESGNCQSSALAITVNLDCLSVVSTPTGDATQTFNAGQTIADLVVNGTNLVWYADSSLTTILPTTTELVNNTTYYVVEEVGNCKSSALEILAIETVSVSNFDLYNFSYYPNPVNDMLHFSSNQPIENVVVTNMLGQQINVSVSNKFRYVQFADR